MEEKKIIELTKEQHRNLIVFLNRVQLTGSEVPAYTDIMTILMKPKEK